MPDSTPTGSVDTRGRHQARQPVTGQFNRQQNYFFSKEAPNGCLKTRAVGEQLVKHAWVVEKEVVVFLRRTWPGSQGIHTHCCVPNLSKQPWGRCVRQLAALSISGRKRRECRRIVSASLGRPHVSDNSALNTATGSCDAAFTGSDRSSLVFPTRHVIPIDHLGDRQSASARHAGRAPAPGNRADHAGCTGCSRTSIIVVRPNEKK